MARTSGSEFLSVPFVLDQISAAAACGAQLAREEIHGNITARFECSTPENVASEERWPIAFDSPLEAAYWAWWEALRSTHGYGVTFDLEPHRSVAVGDQRYVIDFVVVCKRAGANYPLIGIELDGHSFHEKTLEQVTRRNRRDRDLQQAGWKVFHYSFSEFVADPFSAIAGPLGYAQVSRIRTAA